jgi:Flp pilus assembly protein TadD
VPGRVTYTEHVAPILYENCASCHRPGQIAPFSLLTYADAREQATEIGRATLSRQMPPWLPAPGEFPIQRTRRLTDVQIETLQRWIKQGMAEGDPGLAPPVPVFARDWESGTPDLIVQPDEPYVLRPQAGDVYRNIIVSVPVTETRFVRAVEFKTNGAPIHHAVIRLDRSSASRRRAGRDGEVGFAGMAVSASDPDGQFIGWAPGRGPIESPPQMAWRLEPGTDFVVEMHMLPGEADVQVAPTIGLFFTDEEPTRRPVTVKLGSKVIDIPAGKADYLVTDSYVLPVPAQLLSVYPHAHYLGRDLLATLTLPDGTSRTLLHIPQWNFHWQQDYRFETPIPLPAGTRITMRYTYDNSTANPFNPHTPPERVLAGPMSTDEMAEFALQVLTDTPAQAAQLQAEAVEKERRADIALGESRVRDEPGNGEYRAFLGGAYVQVGRFAEALPHLEEAVRLGDRTAATQADLGAAMMGMGNPAAALPFFQRAVALAADDEVLQYNLGTTLAALSRHAEAEAAFRRALALNPDFVDAHVNLGVAQLARRRYAEAIEHFTRAAVLQPESAVLHSNLAGALLSAGRLSEAAAAARRALALDPNMAAAKAVLERVQRQGIR